MKKITYLFFLSLLSMSLQATSCDSITQYGITWYFDKSYTCGQFANGDYWVIGPVTITQVNPGWDGTGNGTMINPTHINEQGYDSRCYVFNDSLRVKFPVTVDTNSSVMSVISLSTCVSGGASQCLSDAAVLTVLGATPPSDAFRPAYFGTTKTIYTTSQVNYNLLPSLPLPSKPLPDVSNYIVRPWLDHGPKVTGAKIHPQNNMPPYPRDASVFVSRLTMMALLNTVQQQEYVNRLIQLGIDLYSISLENGDAWRAYGGFGSGRKWPILFAGLLLNDSAMQHPDLMANNSSFIFKFGEDGHTYYGQPTTDYPNRKPLWGWDCISGGYTPPFFTNHDCRDPNGLLEAEDMTNGGSYRICCTSYTWAGSALATQLLCMDSLWNHQAFFDYMDRWTKEDTNWSNYSTDYYKDIYGYGGNGGGFMAYMWNNYKEYTSPPTFTASNDDTICAGQNANLVLYGIDTSKCEISWNKMAFGNDTSFSFSPTITSNVTASIKYKNRLGCTSTHNFNVTVENCTGIYGTPISNSLKVFPNPTKNKLTISFTANTSLNTEIKINDLQGRLVFSEIKNQLSGNYQTNLDLSKGVYLLHIKTDTEAIIKKIIVN